MSQNIAVAKLIEYLRIKTVHPNPDYANALIFLKNYANEIGFDSCKEIETSLNRSVLVLTYNGTSLDEKSIILNSHTDVVPVSKECWKCDPFEGKIFENGDIYGRGVQDMKSVGIQHLEVIRRMKENNVRPKRTIHVLFVPDEEIGGVTGLGSFVKMQEYRDLNAGVALDEGMASETEEFSVYYGERVRWWLNVYFRGNTGHGSRFIENTAAEKLRQLLNRVLKFREDEKLKLDCVLVNENHCTRRKLGDVTTLNLTGLQGGLAANIVPDLFKASFDIRITPGTDLKKFEEQLQEWIRESENEDTGSITYEFNMGKDEEFYLSSMDENQSNWWKSFQQSCNELNIKLSKEIFPAGTDARYLREDGIPAFGFTPLNNTPILLHDHNEFVNDKVFLEGINILYKVVVGLANC